MAAAPLAGTAAFGERFYLELQRVGRPEEEGYIALAVALAARRAVPVVATNDVRFIKPEDFESHEARVVHARRGAAGRHRTCAPLHGAAVPAHAARDGAVVRRHT